MSYKQFKRETQTQIRKRFSSSEKFKFAQKQKYKCVCELCNGHKDLPPEFDLDHIKPLWAGGTNDDDNIQAICPNGHRFKTANEERNYYGQKRKRKWKRLKSFVMVSNKSQRKIIDLAIKLERQGKGEIIFQFLKQLNQNQVRVVSKYFTVHD